MKQSSISDFTDNTLEKIRKRLIDLSVRNRLINFRHTKTGCLRIVNELTDQVAANLMNDFEIRFNHVPEPTRKDLINHGYLKYNKITKQYEKLKNEPGAEEWSKIIWGDLTYDAPGDSYSIKQINRSNNSVQTLLFSNELETRLRYLWQKAKTSIEETGANILYLAIGFLEWIDSIDNEKKYLAPLFLIPVRLQKLRLNKSTGTYDYTIEYTGEEIIPNLSLKEKLKSDFNLNLPDLDDKNVNSDDTISISDNIINPEEYFERVLKLIKRNKPKWKLHRYITLSLFNFSKLLMYLDLSPDRWPDKNKITNHEIMSIFIDGKSGENNSVLNNISDEEEYNIDEIPNIHEKYPLIEDADSSQHSALIDAINGKNLVIKGPPGTGKSQTITNLIAAAIAQNKTVLFVAEKLAALEVVKRRLDRAGLGDFCLEMHSHKSQKRKILDSIQKRLYREFRKPYNIHADIILYEKLKEKLKSHSYLINSFWKNTNKTIHEILVGASHNRKMISISPKKVQPVKITGENFDLIEQGVIKDLLLNYKYVYQSIIKQFSEDKPIQFYEHPWYGIRNSELQTSDEQKVFEKLKNWQSSLCKISNFKSDLASALNCELSNIPDDLNQLTQLSENIKQIPKLKGNELIYCIPKLQGSILNDTKNYLKIFNNVQKQFQYLNQKFGDHIHKNLSQIENIRKELNSLQQLTDNTINFNTIYNNIKIIKILIVQLEKFSKIVLSIKNNIGFTTEEIFENSESGINEFKIYIELVADLQRSYWKMRDPVFDNQELDHMLPKIRKELDDLKLKRNKLEYTVDIKDLPDIKQLEELKKNLANSSLFRWFNRSYRSSKKMLLKYRVNKKVKFKQIILNFDNIIDYVININKFENNSDYAQILGHYFQSLETDLESLELIRSWYKKIRNQYGNWFEPKTFIGDSILELPEGTVHKIQSFVASGGSKQLEIILEKINKIKNDFPLFNDINNKSKFLIGQNSSLPKLLNILTTSVTICQPILIDKNISIKIFSEHVEAFESLKNNINSLETNDIFEKVFQKSIQINYGLNVDNNNALKIANNTIEIASFFDIEVLSSLIKNSIYKNPVKESFEKLYMIMKPFQEILKNQMDKYQIFNEYVQLNMKDWTTDNPNLINNLIKRNDKALQNLSSIQNWLSYLRIYNKLSEKGFANLVENVNNGNIPIEKIENAYYAGIYGVLTQEIFSEIPDLEKFSGQIQESRQKQYLKIDEKLKKLQCEYIAWKTAQKPLPRGIYGGRISEYTELSLLEHHCNLTRPRISIRKLIDGASKALMALKPCFLMGPMSVAHYLIPGKIEFDLVIMDEASQIKPEDALGSIVRGKQLIVVGDPKQLPPTNFFERIIKDDNNENITAIEESKSILDATIPIFPIRGLRWHYRSQHESLIAFSNYHFYDQRLILFPSPKNKTIDFGIQFTKVQGCFINRKNRIEAKELVNDVVMHFKDNSEDSIGIVAMNSEQRDLIEQYIDDCAKEDIVFQKCLEKDQQKHESLFIKNLENVQGDERDIIYISMTYGPKKIGDRVFQRFGPINSDVGHRRLNVLFTRSRKRMNIYSSMSESDIVENNNSNEGIKALKAFLKYAETGYLEATYDYTNKKPDSDFEIDVANALQKNGFESVAQVGVAGFFIDIAVKDPENPGQYIMGIECDGFTYNSLKSVRDRDRLRQQILEKLGWNIRRIWSTDWFKNPDAELKPIINDLKQKITIKVKEKNIATNYKKTLSNNNIKFKKFINNERSNKKASDI